MAVRRCASLLVLLAFVVAAAVAQANSPPNVAGQWTDGVCNLVPGSDQVYEIRTYFFSAVNTKSLSGMSPALALLLASLALTTCLHLLSAGTYELHQQLFPDPSCAAAAEQMRIVETGTCHNAS